MTPTAEMIFGAVLLTYFDGMPAIVLGVIAVVIGVSSLLHAFLSSS